MNRDVEMWPGLRPSGATSEYALDYLLKPLDDERFEAAVNRARKQLDTASKAALLGGMLRLLEHNGNYASRFVVRTGSRIQVVSPEDVEWIAAAGDYSSYILALILSSCAKP